MNLVQAYLIYDGRSNRYVDNGTTITINCEQLSAFSPRAVWLQSWLPSGDGTDRIYQPTFELTSAEQLQYGTNLIQGFWIEQDGAGMMVDVANIATLISACSACCGSNPAVTLARFYTGGIPLFTTPTEATYCIQRLNDGSMYANNQVALDYASQSHGSVVVKSNLSGVTRYQITTYVGWPPVAIGTDTVATGAC
jgi:hypothetical protein